MRIGVEVRTLLERRCLYPVDPGPPHISGTLTAMPLGPLAKGESIRP